MSRSARASRHLAGKAALAPSALLALCMTGAPALAQEESPPSAPGDAAAETSEGGESNEGLSPVQRFRRGEMYFAYGDCQGTVSALAEIAVPGELGDEKQLVEAHRMLAVCYFQQGRSDEVKRQLESLLFIDPDYELDPFRTPPPVMELFDDLKQTIREKLAAIESARKQRKEKTAKPGATLLVERTTVVRETPFAAVFLPFGLAQWANGEVIKASLLGTAQGLALLTNVGAGVTAVTIDALDQRIGTFPEGDEIQPIAYQSAWLVSTVGLALFVGVYGYGVADAMWNHEDSTETVRDEQRRELTPEEAQRELLRLRE